MASRHAFIQFISKISCARQTSHFVNSTGFDQVMQTVFSWLHPLRPRDFIKVTIILGIHASSAGCSHKCCLCFSKSCSLDLRFQVAPSCESDRLNILAFQWHHAEIKGLHEFFWRVNVVGLNIYNLINFLGGAFRGYVNLKEGKPLKNA